MEKLKKLKTRIEKPNPIKDRVNKWKTHNKLKLSDRIEAIEEFLGLK